MGALSGVVALVLLVVALSASGGGRAPSAARPAGLRAGTSTSTPVRRATPTTSASVATSVAPLGFPGSPGSPSGGVGSASTEPPQQSLSHGLPAVAAIQPSSAAGCTNVTLLGTNLASVRSVVFGRFVAAPTLVSAGSVVVRVPNLGSSPGSFPVQVAAGPVESAATGSDLLTYTGPGACQTTSTTKPARTKKGK